jgi:hypothetical protein
VYERVILWPVDKGEVACRLLIAGNGISMESYPISELFSLHPFLAWHLERSVVFINLQYVSLRVINPRMLQKRCT